MSHASVTDVEARLGLSLSEAEAQLLGVFLEDLGLYIESTLAGAGINPTSIDPKILVMVEARKGVDFILALQANLPTGVTAITETTGDVSRSVSYAEGISSDLLWLSARDRALLGLNRTARIKSWAMVVPGHFDHWGHDGLGI